jgi:hypothetical protein
MEEWKRRLVLGFAGVARQPAVTAYLPLQTGFCRGMSEATEGLYHVQTQHCKQLNLFLHKSLYQLCTNILICPSLP